LIGASGLQHLVDAIAGRRIDLAPEAGDDPGGRGPVEAERPRDVSGSPDPPTA